jgi:hypothetical protein
MQNDKKYIGVYLPQIYDIDEYFESIGFKSSGLNYIKGKYKIILAAGHFCCLVVENDPMTETNLEIIKCQLSFLPDIWLMNYLLIELGFIK